MSNRHSLNLLITLGLLLVLAIPAFAQDDEEKPEPAIMSTSGITNWILKGNKIYYLKWDQSFEQAQTYGPEEIGRSYDPEDTFMMEGTGASVWVLKNNDLYFVTAKHEGSFVTIKIERPEVLPDADSSNPNMMAASGSNAWVMNGEKIYYIKWNHSFEKTEVFGPTELEQNDYGPTKPFLMKGTGNSLWILRGKEIYYVNARQDGSFVDIEIARPEELPE